VAFFLEECLSEICLKAGKFGQEHRKEKAELS